ncbi:MAG: asparaginase [Rhodobacteraceae bacterium]|nr:asparaginase [Paracoccaceae bacterium]
MPLIDLWRGDLLESRHLGHAVICDAQGVVEAWGDPGAVIFPRSSCKMIQALPLLESGAGAGLPAHRLALACASHNGASIHVDAVRAWLADNGQSEADLRCGVQIPDDPAEHKRLLCTGDSACQVHNNCSGKHAGFLTLNRHLRGGPEYTEVDHPVQKAVRDAFEDVTGEDSPGWGVDGCSAPNFATTIGGLARAMARFATATASDARGRAMVALREAMVAHPDLVAGEGRACTELMRAMNGVAIKTGAEAVFVAILPGRGLGVALKVIDGGTRASEAAVVALLARLGVLDASHPMAMKRLGDPIRNRRGLLAARIATAPGFC